MARRKKKNAPKRTVVALVQDKSGSMGSRRDATISGYNEYLTNLRKESEGEVLLTLTQFDTSINDVYSARPLAEVRPLTVHDYVPGGMTALLDAIGRTIRATDRALRKEDRVLVVIMTDGHENSSKEWNKSGILSLLEEKRKDGWEFIYLGAGEEAWSGALDLGFTKDTTFNYTADAVDHSDAFADMAFATTSVTRGGSAEQYLSSSQVKLRLDNKAAMASGKSVYRSRSK